MATISKVSGKSYRVCTDAENDAYDELSFKTDAGDVSFTDGTDAETNLSAIKGITSDMSCEDESIAASAVAVKTLNDSLGVDIKLIDGVPNWSKRGADTWSPFKSSLTNLQFTRVSSPLGVGVYLVSNALYFNTKSYGSNPNYIGCSFSETNGGTCTLLEQTTQVQDANMTVFSRLYLIIVNTGTATVDISTSAYGGRYTGFVMKID